MPPKKVQNTRKATSKPKKDEEVSEESQPQPPKKTSTKKPAKDKAKDEPAKRSVPKKGAKKTKKDESESEEEVKPATKSRSKSKSIEDNTISKATKARKREKVSSDSKKDADKIQSLSTKGTKIEDSESEIDEEDKKTGKTRGNKDKTKPKRGRGKSQSEDLDDEETAPEKKSNGGKKKEVKKVELDPEIPLKNVTVYKEKSTFYDADFIEPHPTDETQNKFFKIQLLEGNKIFSYYRFGTVGQVGEWILRGEFEKKKAKEVYDEKIRDQIVIVKKAEEAKAKGEIPNTQDKSPTEEKKAIPRSPNPSQSKIDPSLIDCPPDKNCPIRDEVEVLIKDDCIYDKKLNASDVVKNSNHFYMFQVLRNKKDPSKHYVFYRYGRVGLHGEWVLRGEFPEEKAIELYRQKEEEQEKRGKYTALDINYQKSKAESLQEMLEFAVEKSSLPKSVAKLIQLIFDFKMINEQMNQAGFDVKKSPLGKLAVSTIEKAFVVLNTLSEEIKKRAGDSVLESLSSQFYTLIPHNVGWKNMKSMTITTESQIKDKIELLESLRQIQIAYELVNNITLKPEDNPIDINYKKLNCKIEPVDPSSDAYKFIARFLDNTKENNKLEIEDMFTINREGETERFMGHIENHLFLWHGSRLTNFVGILSQGLRIAPPEAPASGYRLGKGIYLADMISKSVPYCYASASNNTLCIMICEAALGEFNEKLYDDFNANKLPTGKQSTKALGRTAPPLNSYEIAEPGVKIPIGKPENTEHSSSAFMHNEFVVYDVNQVRIRYLLRVKVKPY